VLKENPTERKKRRGRLDSKRRKNLGDGEKSGTGRNF